MHAAERRESIVQAAMAEFAIKGYHGTATEAIAERAGVSQPYLFRFYPTKKELFIAAIERGFERVEDAFRLAAERRPDDVVDALGEAYEALLQHREALLLQMHAYAACADPEIQAVVRRHYGELYRLVQELTGMSEIELQQFFAAGMLMNVATAMDLPAIVGREPWAESLIGRYCKYIAP
jgi:AcrR family transcriptional regulator